MVGVEHRFNYVSLSVLKSEKRIVIEYLLAKVLIFRTQLSKNQLYKMKFHPSKAKLFQRVKNQLTEKNVFLQNSVISITSVSFGRRVSKNLRDGKISSKIIVFDNEI